MRLYTFQHSPNPLKVRLALAELALDCEMVEINLFKGEHRSDEFKEVNPHQKVPVLQEEGLILRESNAILTHLGRTRHSELWPLESRWEALASQWLFFESFSLSVHCGRIWWTDVVAKAIGRPGANEALLADAVEELERSLDVLESHLSTRQFLLGKSISLPDFSVGVTVAMLRETRLDSADRWPNVIAYRERLRSRPSWTQAGGDKIHQFG
ncbi:MAG: glutathione S-transferase family protein [Deltaproteobacteria bacterium]|nr:glutathione S-transferase family protein [Deltaproteobacteria bacterium]